ncbi:Hypothetical predicted protein [Olea europaea subsp. europaea]|uniref:Uncharacterized protein n=1 Tax=Olea europaea subsp. europaea TaxID=158383 RepID=A0A8S0U4K1_OLEEU|nr:Hypothetical predicted protein [Olea europaea subsp. europaea]
MVSGVSESKEPLVGAVVELDPKFIDFGSGSVLKNSSSLYQNNTLQSGDSVDLSNCSSVGRGQEARFRSLSASGVCVQFQGGSQRHSLNLWLSDKKRKRFDDASRLTATEVR